MLAEERDRISPYPPPGRRSQTSRRGLSSFALALTTPAPRCRVSPFPISCNAGWTITWQCDSNPNRAAAPGQPELARASRAARAGAAGRPGPGHGALDSYQPGCGSGAVPVAAGSYGHEAFADVRRDRAGHSGTRASGTAAWCSPVDAASAPD